MGDSIATNLFMLGYAYQKGLIPLGHEALERAIELNGTAVPMNLGAFRWGRRAAHRPRRRREAGGAGRRQCRAVRAAVAHARRDRGVAGEAPHRLPERRPRRALPARWSRRCARPSRRPARPASPKRWRATMPSCWPTRTSTRWRGSMPRSAFQAQLDQQFEGDYRLKFHLAPPLFASRDPKTGHLMKQEFGAWMLPAFRLLAKLKGLRGTKLDPFGYTARAQDRARADRRIRGAGRRTAGRSHVGQSRARHQARRGARRHPRLRPREGRPSREGQAQGGRASEPVAQPGSVESRCRVNATFRCGVRFLPLRRIHA